MAHNSPWPRRLAEIAQEPALKIALGPVLLAQGLWVRRVTPILAEAAGAREGAEGSGPLLRLLVLGDSAAAGVGVADQKVALVGRLVAQLAPQFQVSWRLTAQSGWTTRDMIAHLKTLPNETVDVVVTSLGVNDVLAGVAPETWHSLQLELIDLMRDKFGQPQIILTHVPPMHRFPSLPQPLRWYLGRRAHALNAQLASISTRRDHCHALAIDFPLTADLMAADGFHPGALGYAHWANQAAQIIRNTPKRSA